MTADALPSAEAASMTADALPSAEAASMTADALPSAEAVLTTEEQPIIRLVVLGDSASAPVCDGDVCYLPPPAADAPTPDPASRTQKSLGGHEPRQ